MLQILLSVIAAFLLYKVITRLTRNCIGYNIKPSKFTIPIPKEIESNWKGNDVEQNSPPSQLDIECRCPATGQLLGSFQSMTNNDIDKLIQNAALAQESSFGNSSTDRRLKILISLRDFIIDNQELIARIACRDSGKTMVDASMGEILVTLEKLNWLIKHGPSILKPSRRPGPTNFFMKWYKTAEVRYEPLGVISAIVSWNYPFHNFMGPIISSIMTGNSIVMKCSEQVIWSSDIFLTMVRNCLIACNEDPNIVQLCYCLPPRNSSNQDISIVEPANYFTAHPGLKHITFIGSQPIAHPILENASKSITPVVVELGGKDAFIVLDSYKDLDSLSSIILRGTFQSAGQNCIGIERVIVSAKNYESLVSIIQGRLEKSPLRLGSDIDSNNESVDMGAMISNNRFHSLQLLINDAVDKGAKLLYGGEPYVHPLYPNGNYFKPTLLVDVTKDMKIAQNEVFGPVLVMMKAQDTYDCIKLANSAPFGLGGSIFGNDYNECNYVVNHLKTGNIAINDFATFYVCQLPFGGINGSGYGKFGGEEGLRGICNEKSVCFDKSSLISTKIPRQLDYPINGYTKDNQASWKFVKSFITAAYTPCIWQRIKSIWSLAKS